MRVPYLQGRSNTPLPSLGGSVIRPRPIMPVRLTAGTNTWILDGLLDTGSDDTVFGTWLASLLGIDLTRVPERDIRLAGRTQPVRCKYASVQLRITDGIHETYEWNGVVGFVSTSLRYALLGYAGFLQFFNVDFRGADQEAILTSNSLFPGKRS